MSACAGILELLVDAEGIEAVASVFVDVFRAFRAELSGPLGRRKEDFNRICGELRREGPPWKFFVIQIFCATSAVPAPDGVKIDLYGSTDRFVSYLLNYATVHMLESVSIIRKATDALKTSIKDKLSIRYVESEEGLVQSVIELDSDSDEQSGGSAEEYGEDFDSNRSAPKPSTSAPASAAAASGPSHRVVALAPSSAAAVVAPPSNDLAPPQSGQSSHEDSTMAEDDDDDYSDDFAEPAQSSNPAALANPAKQGEGKLVKEQQVQEQDGGEVEDGGSDGYEEDFDSHSAAASTAPPKSGGVNTSTTNAPPATSTTAAPAQKEASHGLKSAQEDKDKGDSIVRYDSYSSVESAPARPSPAAAPKQQQQPQSQPPVSVSVPQQSERRVDQVAPSEPQSDRREQRSDIEVEVSVSADFIGAGGAIGGKDTDVKDDLYDNISSSRSSSSGSSSSSSSSTESDATDLTDSRSGARSQKELSMAFGRPVDSQPVGRMEVNSGAHWSESPSNKAAHSATRPASAGPAPSRASDLLSHLVTGAAASDAPKFEPSKPRPATSPSKTRAYAEGRRGDHAAPAARSGSPTRRPASSPARGRPATAGARGTRRDSPPMVRQPKPRVPYQRRNMSSVRSTMDVAADASDDFNRMLDTSKVRVNNLNDLYELLQYKAFEAHKIVIDSYAIWQKKLEEALKSCCRPDLANPMQEYRNRLLRSAAVISRQPSAPHSFGPRSQSAKASFANTLDLSRLATKSDTLSKTAIENITRLNELQESNKIVVQEVESSAQNTMRQVFHARALCSHQPSSVNDRRLEVVSVRAVRVLLSGIQKLSYLCSNLKDSYTNLIKELLGISPEGGHKLQPRPKTLWSRPPDSPQKPATLPQRRRPKSADPRVLRRREEVADLKVEVRARPASALPRSPYSAKKLEMDEDKLYPADVDKWDYLHNISRHRARLNKAIAISREISPPPPPKKSFRARHEDYLANFMLEGEDAHKKDQSSKARGHSRSKQRGAPGTKPTKATTNNEAKSATRRPKISRRICAQCAEKFAGEPKLIPTTASIDLSKVEELRGRLMQLRQQELASGQLTSHQMRILESSLLAQRRKDAESQTNQKVFCSWACARKWNNRNTPPQLRYYSNILIDLMD